MIVSCFSPISQFVDIKTLWRHRS